MNWIGNIFNRARQAAGSYLANSNTDVYVGGVTHKADPATQLGNPLIGLTPALAASYFSQSLRGQWTRLQWLEYHAEHLDADLIALCRLRTGAVGEFNWSIEADGEAKDQVLAREQADRLRELYTAVDNIDSVVAHLEMSLFRGYAHVLMAPVGDSWDLRPLDQWWFVRDGLYGDWYWNPEAKSGDAASLGDDARIDPADYIIREEQFPVIWLACLKFIRANANEKWWDSFCESVAQQGTIITAPQGLSPESGAQFQADALSIARGASGVLPFGSQVIQSNTQRGQIPFEKRLEKLSGDLIKATIGGILAIETRSGSGTLAGGAHQETLDTIVNADARRISEVMQRQFDRKALDRDFPGRDRLAHFELTTREEPDVDKVVTNITTLAAAGYQVDPEQVSEQTGYKVTLKPPETFGQIPGGMGGALPEPAAGATGGDMGTVGPRMQAITQLAEAVRVGGISYDAAVNQVKYFFAIGDVEARQLLGDITTAPAAAPTITNRATPDAGAKVAERLAAELSIPAGWLTPINQVLRDIEAKAADKSVTSEELADYVEQVAVGLPEVFAEMDTEALADMLTTALEGAAAAGVQDSQAAEASDAG